MSLKKMKNGFLLPMLAVLTVLFSFNACQKKQTKTKVESSSILENPDVRLSSTGVLQFKDPETVENYLKLDSVSLDPAFRSYMKQEKRSINVPESFSLIASLFNEEGLLQVGDDLFSLQEKGIYKQSLSQKNQIWESMASIQDIDAENSTYYPLACKGVRSKSEFVKSKTAAYTEIDFTIEDIEDYLVRNKTELATLMQAVQAQKNQLLQAEQNGTAAVKTAAQALLAVEHIFTQLEHIKNTKAKITDRDVNTYYFNTLIREKHPDLMNMSLNQRLAKMQKDPTGLLIAGLAMLLPNIFGGNNNSANNVGKEILTTIQPLLNEMKEMVSALNSNFTALTQTVSTMNTTIHKLDSLLKGQQTQINNQQAQITALQTLLNSTTIHTAAGGEGQKNLFRTGRKSPFIKYLIEAVGATGTDIPKATEAFGEWIDKLDIGWELERSFEHGFALFADKNGKRYYHIIYGYKQIVPTQNRVHVFFKQHSFRVNADYSLVEIVDGKNFNQIKTDLRMSMVNELGYESFFTDKDKVKSLTIDNYPVEMVSYPMGRRNKCTKTLRLTHSSKNYGFDPYGAYEEEIIIY